MHFLNRAKDGGPTSTVDAFFLFEIKSLGSVAILRFNKGGREAFHTHAFNALTWFICGDLVEQRIDGTVTRYRRTLLPKVTRRSNNHRVIANRNSWCVTIRGPWNNCWTEDTDTQKIVLTHGRKIVNIENK